MHFVEEKLTLENKEKPVVKPGQKSCDIVHQSQKCGLHCSAFSSPQCKLGNNHFFLTLSVHGTNNHLLRQKIRLFLELTLKTYFSWGFFQGIH